MADDTPRHEQRKSLKVSKDAYDRHKPRKEEQGLTWDEYLDGQRAGVYDNIPDADTVREIVREEVRAAIRDELTR